MVVVFVQLNKLLLSDNFLKCPLQIISGYALSIDPSKRTFPLHFIIDFSSGACCVFVVFSSSEPASEKQQKHLCFLRVVDFPSSFVLKERCCALPPNNFLSFEDSVKSFLQSCCGERRRRRKMQCKEKLLYHTASLKSYPD